VIDRGVFLRRAGIGAGGLSLAELLGPARALAGGGGGDFPAHPRWRFVFVSHDTLNPLLVATQFGAQDAAALVQCSVRWTGSARGDAKETAKALRAAIAGKADGVAVSLVDPHGFAPEAEAARKAKIPLVAFHVDAGPGNRRLPYIGLDAYSSGIRVGLEIARLAPEGRVLLVAPARADRWTEDRLEGVIAGLVRPAKAPVATVVRTEGTHRQVESKIEAAFAHGNGVRGLFAVDSAGTLTVGNLIKRLGLKTKGVHGGGYDLLPGDLALVADGHLDFVVDQQPYVQGFAPVLQLFLARISQGTVVPWDTETSVLLRKGNVKPFLDTKSRFEGSSSRHEYPLRRE
jgi:simple sugar transport system substrate-binding protein